jgi:hypothetical protein
VDFWGFSGIFGDFRGFSGIFGILVNFSDFFLLLVEKIPEFDHPGSTIKIEFLDDF